VRAGFDAVDVGDVETDFADVELIVERIVAAPSLFNAILPRSPSSMTPVDAPAVPR
jgi:hypothetical protein